MPSVVFANATWGSMLQLSRNPLPVASHVMAPVLGYSAVLEIEKTLQWTVRNTMTCSLAVYGLTDCGRAGGPVGALRESASRLTSRGTSWRYRCCHASRTMCSAGSAAPWQCRS